jgi:hypothetical protein
LRGWNRTIDQTHDETTGEKGRNKSLHEIGESNITITEHKE